MQKHLSAETTTGKHKQLFQNTQKLQLRKGFCH